MRSGPSSEFSVANSERIKARVRDSGWTKLRTCGGSKLEAEVFALAHFLGTPAVGRRGRILEFLVPRSSWMANRNSLSALHGQGPFPLHTDGAHLPAPPRFLVLACDHPGSCPVPTIIQHFDNIGFTDAERRSCEDATFLIRNGRRSFYSTVLSLHRPFIRFDQGCMVPSSDEACAVMHAIATKFAMLKPTEVHWRAGDILVIDNWRVLHGRGRTADRAAPDRRLLRVSVQ